MRASLDEAHAEAERLVQEAEAQARGLPPRGWASPGSGTDGAERRTPGVGELQALLGLIDLALQVFTFVEGAVLLVALAVLFLVYARAQQRGFHLPGGDGLVTTLGGAWAELLLIWRLFDKPDVSERAATVGIAWGMFAAMVAA